ncbi:DMT family transporter [Companilactobacillus alimentarius]|uniref:QacE family quaternary ammonium compound efflux SMR transporter n=1 Tax=Companilactobacillus alimentarius DSM 20249 TaxID=1423720 RepID=A0A2K9HLQ0_9LACO|nr:multidrug efflux SMR transporter [Companilactobacillus alimentarius]AUI70793.1 QacE family quaternary ammonium compound efflux SMR transporter [Companilactobacillus alimentarius DSM 20249]KRK77633.1 membrane transporter [Companilactobacillus alimentarius DSM 20249]MDT6952032.1 multidrug efflux SMR transporter [Companilactobacillus alimentarius]GEO45253.1 QacE family quaternary ammonium compound efflux SMR transporter [Companilactobacillus alimentarius]
MSWIYLIIAGLFEVVWSTTMKLSHGFSKISFTIYTIVGLALSMLFLAIAIKKLPMSLAYPIWTGIGAVGSVIIGVILFGDKLSPLTWIFVVLLLISIIGIKISSGN